MRNQSLKDILEGLPQPAKDYLSGKGALSLKREPYFSRIRFEPTITDNTSNVVYTFAQGQSVNAFDYGQGGTMAGAGFVAGGTGFTVATAADTNLTTAAGRVTNGSDMVVVDAICFLPTPKSDPVLLKALIAELSVTGGFGGNLTDYRFGNPLFLPGGGGLYGGGQSALAVAGTNDSKGQINGFISNGLPGAGDMWPQDDAIVWMPKPEADSDFAMQVRCNRTVSVTVNARTAGSGGIAPAAVAPPVTAGADGTFVEFLVRLVGTQIGPRSRSR
jgi:hypothetical protein